MRMALAQASACLSHGDVPVGAVAVAGGKVLAEARNERELRNDPTAHAEMLVLRSASAALGSWRLIDVTVFVTLEPCPMCAGALAAARVKRIVYGAQDPRAGAVHSLYNIVQDPRLNHSCEVSHGVLEDEASGLLRDFFGGLRA